MRIPIAIRLAALPLLLAPVLHAQDSINPDAADGGDGTQIVVPQHKPASAPPTDLHSHAAASSPLEIDADACRYAVQHVPAPDVEYTAGVDANGNPVAPADLGPRPPMRFPTTVAIPITSNVARMLSAVRPTTGTTGTTGTATPTTTTPSTSPAYRADALIGMVSLVDGRLYFNGQPIGDDPDAELAALCRKAAAKEASQAQ